MALLSGYQLGRQVPNTTPLLLGSPPLISTIPSNLKPQITTELYIAASPPFFAFIFNRNLKKETENILRLSSLHPLNFEL